MLKETKITNNGILYKTAYEEKLTNPKYDKKTIQRYKIQNEVFDLEDSVADNAKWLSILTTLMSRIYDILDDDQKAKLLDTDKQSMDYLFGVFANTDTRADVQFQAEGFTGVVERILSRQQNIGNIVR